MPITFYQPSFDLPDPLLEPPQSDPPEEELPQSEFPVDVEPQSSFFTFGAADGIAPAPPELPEGLSHESSKAEAPPPESVNLEGKDNADPYMTKLTCLI